MLSQNIIKKLKGATMGIFNQLPNISVVCNQGIFLNFKMDNNMPVYYDSKIL